MMRLPDETLVRVKPCLGDSYVITLGEACQHWKDARTFGIDGALSSRGEWRSLGLTIKLEEAA